MGGTHLTNSALLVNRILKELTATEDTFYGGYVNTDYLLSLTEEEANLEQDKLYRLEGQECWAANRDPVSQAKDIQANPPWWLECNPQRYPYWFGKHDPRNRDLIKALRYSPHPKYSAYVVLQGRAELNRLLQGCLLLPPLRTGRPCEVWETEGDTSPPVEPK